MTTKKITDVVTAYKGFDRNWRCRHFQYAIGQTYAHYGDVIACSSGFHACEYPLDVLTHYLPSESRYAVVKQSGDLSRDGCDSKIASSNIEISAEIDIAGLVKAAIDFTFIRSISTARGAATGDSGAASAAGYRGAASATGMHSVAVACGRSGRVIGVDGCAIFLVYRNDDDSIKHARAAIVGRDGIKPSVWYSLNADGAFIECGGNE
jgi:hypothetical protein